MKVIIALLLPIFCFLNQLHAADVTAAAPDTGSSGGTSFESVMASPGMVIAVSAIGTIYSGVLYQAAADQEKESAENIKHIDKIIKRFGDGNAILCPQGRDDLKNPKCYCYNADGKKNENRSNSQTCTALWAKNDYMLDPNAADYNLAEYIKDPTGCVTVNNQFDQDCKCRKMVNSQGQNACKKVTSMAFNNQTESNLASATDLGKVMEYANSAFSGTPNFNILSEAELRANAIKTKKMTEQMISKLPEQDKKNLPKVNERNAERIAKALLGEKAFNSAAASYASNFRNGLGETSSEKTNQILAAAKEQAGLAVDGTGKGLAKKDAKKKVQFNFGDVSSEGGNGQVIGGFESPTYKYKNSDIVTDKDASIFEVINNRYVQSGLRRLFDDGSTNGPNNSSDDLAE